MKRPLRVGFDLDGVLLYNPLRIIRHPISIFKRNILNIKVLRFYYPKTRIEKFIWRVLHLSSIFVAPGLDEIQELVRKGYIEAYIMTARYGFLKGDTKKWYKKLGVGTRFKALYHNTDKQPHLFKEQVIKKLKLDVYIDDNYDIVKHTDKTTSADIYWVFNIFDTFISYKNKCTGLPSFLSKIKEKLYKKGYSKKLLLVTEYFPPHWTGIAKTFSYLAKNLQQQGYQVTILTTKFNSKLKDNDTYQHINIIRIAYLIKLSRTHYSPQSIIKFIKLINRFDGVVINSPNSNILFYSLITKLFGKYLAIYHQGDIKLPRLTGNRIINIVFERLFDLMTLPSMFLADIISTDTLDYANNSRVMKYFTNKFVPFIAPISIVKSNKSNLPKKLAKLNKNYQLIGFAGRFVEEKGFDILIKAIPQVKKNINQVKFVFAGQTNIDYEPFYAKLKPKINQYQNDIIFLGLLNEKQLYWFYKQIDIFVISSRSDCFPTTQIEASLLKTPIVVTNIPGARMLVKETGFGEITAKENSYQLAQTIIKVLKNKNRYQKFYPNVKKFIKKYDRFNIG